MNYRKWKDPIFTPTTEEESIRAVKIFFNYTKIENNFL